MGTLSDGNRTVTQIFATIVLFPQGGNAVRFFHFVFVVSGSASFVVFFAVLLFLGSLLEKFSGANFCLWVSLLVLCFLVGFCLCFCFMFWQVAPESVWKNSLDVRSGVFWARSLFLWFFSWTSFFAVFLRDTDQVVTGHPHTHLFGFSFSLFVSRPRFLFRPFWPCVLLLGVSLGVPFWAPRVFGLLLELMGLELARPF